MLCCLLARGGNSFFLPVDRYDRPKSMDSGSDIGFEGTPPAASPSDGAHGSTGSTAPAADGTETPPASTTPPLSLSMRRLAIANAAASSSSGGNGDGDDDDSAAASVEILSKVASFLSPGKTLHDLCMLSADRSDAAYILQEYLTDNEEYVIWSLRALEEKLPVAEWPHSSPELMDSLSTHRQHFVKCRDNIVAWMEVNTDWRDRCTEEGMEACLQMRAPQSVLQDWQWERRESHRLAVPPLCSVMSVFNNPAIAVELGLPEVIQHQLRMDDANFYDANFCSHFVEWRGFCRGHLGHVPWWCRSDAVGVDIFELALRRGDKATIEVLFSSVEELTLTDECDVACVLDRAAVLSSVDTEAYKTVTNLPVVNVNTPIYARLFDTSPSNLLHEAIVRAIELLWFVSESYMFRLSSLSLPNTATIKESNMRDLRYLRLRAEKFCALVDAGADVHHLGIPTRYGVGFYPGKCGVRTSPLGFAERVLSDGMLREECPEAFDQFKESFLDVIIKKMESVDP